MRFSFAIPIVLSVVGFVFSLLVFIAGKNQSLLPSIYLVRIDTSNIQAANVSSSASISNNSFSNLTPSQITQLADTPAERIGLRDFYTAHITNYCEGYMFIQVNDNNETTTKEQITYCAPSKLSFRFDPIQIFSSQLTNGMTVDALGLPAKSVGKIQSISTPSKFLAMSYMLGISHAALVIVLSPLPVLLKSKAKFLTMLVGSMSFLSFFGLAMGSLLGAVISSKVRNAFSDAGGLNVGTQMSMAYIMLTWAAVGNMLGVVGHWGREYYVNFWKSGKGGKEQEGSTFSSEGSV